VKLYSTILNNETIFKFKMFWLPFELSFRYTQYGHTLHKQNIYNLETFNIILIGFFFPPSFDYQQEFTVGKGSSSPSTQNLKLLRSITKWNFFLNKKILVKFGVLIYSWVYFVVQLHLNIYIYYKSQSPSH